MELKQCYWDKGVFCDADRMDCEGCEYQPPEDAPATIVRLNCSACGGVETLVCTRSRYNGHLWGTCEKCGHQMML